MKAVVTGGAGFIGSYLADKLIKEGNAVVVLDRFSYGKRKNFAGSGRKNLSLITADISDPFQIKSSYFTDVDWVFHLAGLSAALPSFIDPSAYHQTNVSGTVHILEACRKRKIKKFIYCASASCYGEADVFPTPESAAIKTDSPFALTKNLGELYTLHFGKVYKLPVVSLRLFNVYGPRLFPEGGCGPIVSKFIAQKQAGKAMTVEGNGRQTRDFVYISDVIEAFIKVAASNISQEVFNVGSGKSESIKKLAELIGGKIRYVKRREHEISCTQADITKIKKMLGWQPKISLKDGIKAVIDTFD